MKIKGIITGICFLVLIANLNAQSSYSLQACVERAIQSNLQIENSELALHSAAIDLTQAKHARLPNLSFNTNVGWNFGRTVDPTQNLFTTETFFNNGAALNSNVVLFNGNRINNIVRQSLANHHAADNDLEQLKIDISLQVTSLYLNILFAKENLANAQRQLNQTNEQLELLNKQIAVGNLPENDRLEIEAQIAVNEQSIIENENMLRLQLLNMKQLLRLNTEDNFDIVIPNTLNITTDPELVTFSELMDQAKFRQPSLASAEWRIKSAILGEKTARAEGLPVLAAGGNLRTTYSNKGMNIVRYEQQIVEQDIYFNNQAATIGIPQNIPIVEQAPYWNQLEQNISYGLGITLNVPIYSNYNIKASQQRAKLNTERAQINYEQSLESLKTTVAQAHADAKAAKVRYFAAEKSKNAQATVYQNALKRFELGNTSIFELNRIKTLAESAETNHLIAWYDYIFRTKVLEFYLGYPINLN